MQKSNQLPPPPKPLFDDGTEKSYSTCIQSYLQQINIPNYLKEYELAVNFLNMYKGSEDTYTSYRREIEKLYQWTWLIQKQSIKLLNREHILRYLEFINNPPISWIGTKTVARFILDGLSERTFNPMWRPFVARISKSAAKEGKPVRVTDFKLSSKSLQAVFSSLSSFFTYLQQESYIETNPITLIRQKNKYLQKHQEHKVTRKLTDKQWQAVIEVVTTLAEHDPKHIRSLFIIASFFLMGLRISELAETSGRIPRMGDFAPDKHGLWWFTTVGKGNKVRDVAVPDELLELLKIYRTSIGLSPLPRRGEDTPLLKKEKGQDGLGTRQIRNIVQHCFDKAIKKLEKENKLDDAEDLKTATVHWLRHTSISYDIINRPREHVRDDVGHENPATTERYIDTDRLARHQSAQHKKLNPFLKADS